MNEVPKIESPSRLCTQGHPVDVGHSFCSECGSPVSECENGHPIDPGNSFCATCGSSVAARGSSRTNPTVTVNRKTLIGVAVAVASVLIVLAGILFLGKQSAYDEIISYIDRAETCTDLNQLENDPAFTRLGEAAQLDILDQPQRLYRSYEKALRRVDLSHPDCLDAHAAFVDMAAGIRDLAAHR